MSAVKIKENIYWVGAIDRKVRSFHGYLTPYGSTYNSYLVLDDKISLIDTVKVPFTEELIDNIKEIIDPEKIDYLIVNHVEPDHSGALPKLVSLCKNAQIVTSPNGKKGLNAYYGDLGEMRTVKTGETLTTGKYSFSFVLMPMVHWPDSMSTYLCEEQILFSNDAFGQHIASDERFDDEIGLDRLLERAQDYYANIVLPFGAQVQKLLSDVSTLPGISVICPSHGVVLRSFIGEMAEKYSYWSAGKSDDKKAVIVFDTMWGATRQIARNIAAEYAAKGIVQRDSGSGRHACVHRHGGAFRRKIHLRGFAHAQPKRHAHGRGVFDVYARLKPQKPCRPRVRRLRLERGERGTDRGSAQGACLRAGAVY